MCVLIACNSIASVSATGRAFVRLRTDSLGSGVPFSEYTHIYKTKRVSSTYPIKIKMKGNSLQVTSRHSQMLPVYKGNGVFYGLFRLNKGTNWISGLPKVVYIINNSKIMVS